MALNRFWEYSLMLYQRPGVAEFCLRLQDGTGGLGDTEKNTEAENSGDYPENANVNLLLFCCWLGSQGVKLSGDDIIELEAEIEPWHRTQILPLRVERRTPGITQQRKRELLERELAAEQVEQEQLFHWFQNLQNRRNLPDEKPGHSLVSESIRHNLSRYLLAKGTFSAENTQIPQVLFEGNPLQREAEQRISSRSES